MRARIFSLVARRLRAHGRRRLLLSAAIVGTVGGAATAEVPGYRTDPATGQVYREVTRTVERPEVTTRVERRERTVYTPKTVTESRPETRTVYSPVMEYRWVPRLHNRWNPFRAPTVVYHHEPTTRWEARNVVVNRTMARTEWVAEKRVEEVPVTERRIVREQRVHLEPVGTLAPRQAQPPGTSESIASRLRPLRESELSRVVPRGTSLPAGNLASSNGRSVDQAGHRPTDLVPTLSPSFNTTLPPAGSIATPIQNYSVFR